MDALIVDIDGTLAHHFDIDGKQTRGHHDYAKVGEDRPDWHIIHLVRLYSQAGYSIVITSGRPSSRKDVNVRKLTVDWLMREQVPFDELFMRQEGDYRPDYEVKSEIYENYILPLGYQVDFALDDRDQIVKMWRALGIKTLQVEPGDF